MNQLVRWPIEKIQVVQMFNVGSMDQDCNGCCNCKWAARRRLEIDLFSLIKEEFYYRKIAKPEEFFEHPKTERVFLSKDYWKLGGCQLRNKKNQLDFWLGRDYYL